MRLSAEICLHPGHLKCDQGTENCKNKAKH